MSEPRLPFDDDAVVVSRQSPVASPLADETVRLKPDTTETRDEPVRPQPDKTETDVVASQRDPGSVRPQPDKTETDVVASQRDPGSVRPQPDKTETDVVRRSVIPVVSGHSRQDRNRHRGVAA